MSYIINGPVTIGNTGQSSIIRGPVTVGDTTQNTTINGPVFTPTLTNQTGDIIYCSNGGTGALTRLGVGTNGQVLTLASGLPSWAAASGGGTTATGFSALKSGTQAVAATAGNTTTSQITTWVVTSPGYNGTGTPFNTGTSNFTVPTTGTYTLTANVAFTDTTNKGSRAIDVYNSTTATVLFRRTFQPTPDIGINQQAPISAQMALTATHVIQLRFTVTAGSTANTSTILASPDTWWGMAKFS